MTYAAATELTTVVVGNLVLNLEKRILSGPAARVELHDRLFRLTLAMLRRPEALFSIAALVEALWDEPGAEPEHTEIAVRSAVCDLQAALRTVAPDDAWIRTERGVGYALMVKVGVMPVGGCISSRVRGRVTWGNRPSRLVRSIQAHEAARAC